jgi:Na+-driven multidrug efflux pump
MPIKKLIINMSLPIMVSMLVEALYNVVDSIFVAQISENAAGWIGKKALQR